MRLSEVEFNFAKDVGDTISSISSMAKRLHGALTTDQRRAEADAKAAAKNAATKKASGEADKKSNSEKPEAVEVPAAVRAAAAGSPVIRINLATALVELIDKPPEVFLNAFEELDEEQFQELLNDVQKLEIELTSFPKNFKSLMKSSQFLADPQKTSEKLDAIVRPVDDPEIKTKFTSYIANNPNDLHSALIGVLIDPSLDKSSKAVLKWLGAQDAENQRFNDSKPMASVRSVGSNLAWLFNGYVMQALVPKIEELIPRLQAVKDRPQQDKPLTNEAILAALKMLKT